MVLSFDDLDRVGINLLDAAYCGVTCVQVVHESPPCGLGPGETTAKVVLVDSVLPRFKSKAYHVVAN